ncbi:type IV pilin-like G/H family protein [Oculatella sp. LEGE 06141]|uniref:type IV pilin-like G/H family protein n=1 Tax=Oculatella sp. LEGE 06141 TaxID=1828648 RepID=UPI00188168DC|nr:type IV pilin-like G/H family protein [Oculatella sp. LEGE 06141]MBE9177199.1 type IV pilin-like G/H family protein [Oculatella sp. LEGE 06141]
MKSEFKTKFLQHLLQKKENKGFTLIELLVVIIIIGILSAIALPSFLNQANKAKQSEAKTYVGSINKGQQAYFAEKSKFGTDILDLGVGIATETNNYTYATSSSGTGTSVTAITKSALTTNVTGLRNYSGMVSLQKGGATSDLTSVAVLCEQKEPGVVAANPTNGTACSATQQLVGS